MEKESVPTWYRTKDKLPEEGQRVEVVTSLGNQLKAVYRDKGWYLQSTDERIYLKPQLWRPDDDSEQENE